MAVVVLMGYSTLIVATPAAKYSNLPGMKSQNKRLGSKPQSPKPPRDNEFELGFPDRVQPQLIFSIDSKTGKKTQKNGCEMTGCNGNRKVETPVTKKESISSVNACVHWRAPRNADLFALQESLRHDLFSRFSSLSFFFSPSLFAAIRK